MLPCAQQHKCLQMRPETTEAIANEAHGNIDEKRLVNTGDGSIKVLNSTNDSHSAKDQLQQDNKMSLVQENPVRKILMNKPKKGKRGSLENITNGTIENIVPNAKSAPSVTWLSSQLEFKVYDVVLATVS